ncbi:probable elongation factor 1-delta isoform X1 [Anopheles stephensi]|uniref:probable elongation factor 1-delta isoform X1 n=1 Tax=Anopheles stephensi TaxID=30069 RepID=UPI00165891B4|nr:probable elongation factor 1-delta isoform X1 [Anopheles stephensi]
MAAAAMAHEKVWQDKSTMNAAEKTYYEYMAKLSVAGKMESQDGVPATGPKIEQPKKGNAAAAQQQSAASQQRQQQQQQQGQARKMDDASVESSSPPSPPAADAAKAKKDKKKRNKGKKDSTPTDTESSEKSPVVAADAPAPKAQPPAVAEQAEPPKESGKKKSKKSKKPKGQEDASADNDSNKYQEQQNAKNLKEKENLAHKLCDNITEELNKINSVPSQCTLASEISKARQHIKNSLERMDGIAALAASPGAELLDRLSSVEKENEKLRSIIDGLNNLVIDLHERVRTLESGKPAAAKPAAAAAPKPAAPAKKVEAEDDDDDDVDLFGSEDEDEDKAAAELREKRLAEYAAKKSKKPALIAKSNVILDIKPWDDETDMKVMEQEVRKISADGLLLGAAKLVPLAYGIHKLQMSCVIEDDKISVDWLQEEIEKIEDYVQSVDIAAFNKI